MTEELNNPIVPILLNGRITDFGSLREGISTKDGKPYAFMDIRFQADAGGRLALTLTDELARRTNQQKVLYCDGRYKLFITCEVSSYTNRNGYPAYTTRIHVTDLQPVL